MERKKLHIRGFLNHFAQDLLEADEGKIFRVDIGLVHLISEQGHLLTGTKTNNLVPSPTPQEREIQQARTRSYKCSTLSRNTVDEDDTHGVPEVLV